MTKYSNEFKVKAIKMVLKGNSISHEKELSYVEQLEQENYQLRMENDLLKKWHALMKQWEKEGRH